MTRILFVCSGNTCRSPLAEAIARQTAVELGLTDIEVSSAGTSAWHGSPPSDGALLVGLERGLDLNAHKARELNQRLVREADLILAMGPRHLEAVESLGGAGKTHLLTAYAARAATGESVNDPFGGDLDVYRATADELQREIRRALERLAQERSPRGPS